MKNKLFSLAVMLGIAAIIPFNKQTPSATVSLQSPAEELAPVPPMDNAASNQISGKYFTTDKSQFEESDRLLAQKKSGKSKKATNSRKKSLLPGQFPESSERLLTEKDVEHQTPWGMKVMLNEIYARQGYIFKDADLRKHFAKEKWYKGKERSLSKIKLTQTEVQNIEFIKRYQKNAKI